MICDSPSYKWSEFSADNVEQVQLISIRERDALWTRLRAQERPTSSNMPEFWIVYVPGEITQMNWMMHHTYSDAWSLGIVLRDLEALLEDADRDLSPAPGFLPLDRRLATRATRDQDAINTYWREYAHPHAKEVRLLKLPPQSLSTFVATSLDQEDGHTSRKEVPGISKAARRCDFCSFRIRSETILPRDRRRSAGAFCCGITGIVQWWYEHGCCNFSNEGLPGNTFRLVENIDALT